jgi:hypothetical protein
MIKPDLAELLLSGRSFVHGRELEELVYLYGISSFKIPDLVILLRRMLNLQDLEILVTKEVSGLEMLELACLYEDTYWSYLVDCWDSGLKGEFFSRVKFYDGSFGRLIITVVKCSG